MLPSDPAPFRKNTPGKVYPIEIAIQQAYKTECEDDIHKLEKQKCFAELEKKFPSSTIRSETLQCKIEPTKFDHTVILLPLFLGSFTYANNSYQFIITGSLGVVEGKRPVGAGLLGKKYQEAVNTIYQATNSTQTTSSDQMTK